MRHFLLCLLALPGLAEVAPLGLRETVRRALRQNPELILARLEEQKAALAVTVAADAFHPKLFAGSGLAYSNGFPMSIEGAAPSIIQARALGALFNRPQSYLVAQSREQVRAAAIDTEIRQQRIALETALLFLDSARWQRTAEALARQLDGLLRVEQVIRLRVQEGHELPIESRRAALAVAKARHRLSQAEQMRDQLATRLALAIGLPDGERVQAVHEESAMPPAPGSEEACVEAAIANSRQLRKLESAIAAKQFELQRHKSSRLPSLDIVAQYGLFARFNNYEDFFRKFQRHNAQLGLALQIPLWLGRGSAAQAAQAEAEIRALRAQIEQTRKRLALEARMAFQNAQLAAGAREIARQELELSREQTALLLAQLEEGRISARQFEQAAVEEQQKWIDYWGAHFQAEQAKLELLQASGELPAALN